MDERTKTDQITGKEEQGAPQKKPKAEDRLRTLDLGQSTRRATILALALSTFASIVSGWLLFAMWWNASQFATLREARVLPNIGANFDAIAAAAAVGRLDVLAMILTLVAAIAALSLVYGFTVFRTAATRAAIEEVDRRMPLEMAEHMETRGHSLLAAALDDYELIARLQVRFTTIGIGDTETAERVDRDANWKEQAG